jgi:mRNA turnover protein 4
MMSLDPPENLPHSLEPQLRGLGMPTELKRGVPTLTERFVVTKKGEKLTAEKAQILKHLLIKDAKFRLIPMSYWTEESKETKAFPLSIEDDKVVSELNLTTSTTPKTKISNSARTAAKKNSKKSAIPQMNEDDGMDEDDDDDEESDNDDAIVGDKVTKSMMLPAGL